MSDDDPRIAHRVRCARAPAGVRNRDGRARHGLRLELTLARQLLSNPQLAGRTISSIAGAAGFGDLSYFNRTFRRRYSVTPSDVRSGGGLSEGSGFPVLSVLPAGAGLWRAGAVSRFGEADRMRRDRRSDLDAVAGSGTMDRRVDGTVQPRLRRRVSLIDQW